jgi:phytoene dehydrogenase-like protein
VRGGLHRVVDVLARRVEDRGGRIRYGAGVAGLDVAGRRVRGVRLHDGERLPADVVIWNGDAAVLGRLLGRRARRRARSVSGLALMLGVRGRTPGRVHHEIAFPADYDAEFDDVFGRGRLPRDPTVYVSTSSVTDPGEAPPDGENLFVLVNAPAHADPGDVATAEERVVDRLGVRDRLVVRARRTPADLQAETGAVGGAIYGAAPHGRLGTIGRPGPSVPGVRGLFRVGGTAHPGGGLPLVVLSAQVVAGLVDRA